MEPDITQTAALVADSARSKMLIALLGGKALTATELALEADISAQTTSSHLAKLVEGGLLVVRKQGRHRYFQLAGYEIAELLEQLMNVTASINPIHTGPSDTSLRHSRVCYDHLAGEVAVQLYDSLVAQGLIEDALIEAKLTETGKAFFIDLGADIEAFERQKRPVCKACLDWSERRTHIAGSLGKWILEHLLSQGWAQQLPDSRVIEFTPKGIIRFRQTFIA
ncbi:ArsR/SmtB family transcription factor [Grimontia marina]|uniref:Helix-turn-helix domain protein n=1 Tax=Grimontia marina TaxID=646534 RepID=A0A128FIZ2_9GAMM|nr:winged helix-turn-helix domain-containing protein [Grimontia marina]CZF86241.1 Helix-turn-helix domain protein [Grimontia marina]